tara:strand:+ start:1404 stop:1508 length:105 start_codon:yes stop_codon:yes gene_type:complete
MIVLMEIGKQKFEDARLPWYPGLAGLPGATRPGF